MVLCGLIWVSLIGKFVLQLQMMLLVDCTITNIQNFILEKIVDLVPLSNLLKEGENFGLDEEIRISWEIKGAGRFIQLIQSTFRHLVLARASS